MALVRRAEVMRRLGVTSNQLQYFERSGVLESPERKWDNRQKPEAYYTHQQMAEIKAIAHAKPLVNGKELRLIVSHLRSAGDIDRFLSSYLVIKGDRLYSISPECLGQELMKIISEDGGGTFRIIQPIGLLKE